MTQHYSMRCAVRKVGGIYYYPDIRGALAVQRSLLSEHPGARVVAYRLGWAVQYRRSGPYSPERAEA
jgi:hypothetical protein